MEFTDYMWVKLIGGAIIIGVVNFFYTLITGRSITEARLENRDREGRQ